ncbi:MAG: DUF4190 domain-containing protein [Solirubrobacteraceae bacterium]
MDGYAPPTATTARRPGKATTALVLGIISIPAAILPLAGLILGIIAIVFGAVARSEIRRHRLRGEAPALAGLILGSVGLILAIANGVAGAIMAS